MEAWIQLKDAGLQKMNDKKYSQAIDDFTQAIIDINVTDDESAVLKITCLLNRSACYYFIDKGDEGLADADAVIEVYKSRRAEEDQAKMTLEQINQDPLTPWLSYAYVRRGQYFEAKGELLKALQEYSTSTTLNFQGDGQIGFKSVFTKLGVPDIDQTDKELSIFSNILIHFLSEVNIQTAITNLLILLREGEVDDKLIGKFNNTGCARILYAAIQCYLDNEMVVVASLVALALLAQRGVIDVFNGTFVIRVALEHWKSNVNIVGPIVKILTMAPPNSGAFQLMLQCQMQTALCDALNLDLKDDEKDDIYYVLYQLTADGNVATQIASEGALDSLLERRTLSGFILLSKLAQVNDLALKADAEGCVEWGFEILEANPENTNLLMAVSILITDTYIALAGEYEKANEEGRKELDRRLKERALKVYEKLFPVATKLAKDADMAANLFGALASCAEYAVDFIREKNVVKAASVVMAMHVDDVGCALNITSLFYTLVFHGFLADVKETRGVVQGVLKALEKHSAVPQFVERATAVLYECGIESKDALLEKALQQSPESPILLKYKK